VRHTLVSTPLPRRCALASRGVPASTFGLTPVFVNIVRSVDPRDNSTVRESRHQPIVLETIEDRLRRRSRQVEADQWHIAEALTVSERTPQGHVVHASQRADGL